MAEPFGTDAGGRDYQLQQTRWTQILLAQQGDTAQRQAAIGTITEQYWRPVYFFMLRKGLDNETAKDLTQGFFTDVILGRELIAKADPGKGRFRSFLLTAANNYARDFRRRQAAARRSPEHGLVSLERSDVARVVESSENESPEDAFNRAWASALLDQVLSEVEHQCRQAGQAKHWEVFRRRVFLPIASGGKPESYADLCRRLDIDGAERATTMNVTVKRKFEAALRRRVRQLVDSEDQVDEEIQELMRILSKSGAR